MAAAAIAGIVAHGCALASFLWGGGLHILTTQQGCGGIRGVCTLVLFLSNCKLISCQCQLSWRTRGAPGSCPSSERLAEPLGSGSGTARGGSTLLPLSGSFLVVSYRTSQWVQEQTTSCCRTTTGVGGQRAPDWTPCRGPSNIAAQKPSCVRLSC
jgi:hypothetical protein